MKTGCFEKSTGNFWASENATFLKILDFRLYIFSPVGQCIWTFHVIFGEIGRIKSYKYIPSVKISKNVNEWR